MRAWELSQAPVIDRWTSFEALPEFLSPDEVRVYLSLSRSTVYDLLRRGALPSVKFGRCIRIPKSAFQQPAAAAGVK